MSNTAAAAQPRRTSITRFTVDLLPLGILIVAAVLFSGWFAGQQTLAVTPTGTGSATGTAGLDPLLATAYSLAESEANSVGVPLSVTSGYRTYDEQQWLWLDALNTYGSPDIARRWVLPPNESSHVAGRAVDVGPAQGAAWLQANGNKWGLCRTYENEWWHFELATVPGGICPPMRPDASGG